jgi:bifunctional non-homologous end joining protein LigD
MPERGDGGPEQTPETATDRLATYRAKRSADRSPEPVGTVSVVPGRLFVVHKHAASHLHFDLRMEMEGVLKSWAVPKGPSYDMNDKRLAVRVEDHPMEYGDFEGIIPKGNYGAGGIIVWDRGEWVPLEDWREGLEKGKLAFELRGYKLRGKWALVKTKRSEKDWLLLKERDAYVKSPGDQFDETSVLSGLTVEQVKAGERPTTTIRAAVAGSGAVKSRVDPREVKLMLAESRDDAFTSDDWLFELKLDGYRLLASKRGNDVLLSTRNGLDYTAVFPEIARAIRALPHDACILDGEVVVMDAQGKPSFARLQRRGRLTNTLEIGQAAVELPATFFAFDLLAFEDFDLRGVPLVERRRLLAQVVPSVGPVRGLDHLAREGELMFREVTKLGLEGIVAKRADSSYSGRRSSNWLKIKADRTGDFVIVGYTQPKGTRSFIGALQLAEFVEGRLCYVGRVGTGMDEATLRQLIELISPDIRRDAPCHGMAVTPGAEPVPSEGIPDTATTTWVEPRYVCEVQYREMTPDGLLRHSSFLRLRDDKRPDECERTPQASSSATTGAKGGTATAGDSSTAGLRPSARNDSVVVPSERSEHPVIPSERSEHPVIPSERSEHPVIPSERSQHPVIPSEPSQHPVIPSERSESRDLHEIKFSNLKKVYWPADRLTKGDLIEYYRAASRWMLPYLRNRPLVMTRFPDGIDGKQFYQKDAPEFAPAWVRTHPIWSEESQRTVKYFVCDEEDSLLYIANLGCIPIHVWASSVGSLEQCDWCVIDLDPKEAPFSDVIRCAQALHRLCDEIALPHYVKTTGKTGLHIMVPLARLCTYEQSRTLGELLARVMLRETGDIATITRHVTKRGDKVYLDYLQNRHGQTIVAPFSVRPLPGATVSMPLLWEEVVEGLNPKDFTIRNAIERMERLGTDPVAPVLHEVPDLTGALARLATLL